MNTEIVISDKGTIGKLIYHSPEKDFSEIKTFKLNLYTCCPSYLRRQEKGTLKEIWLCIGF